jgi:hypothetical protein
MALMDIREKATTFITFSCYRRGPTVAGCQCIGWYPTKRFLLYAMSGYWHYTGIHSSLSKSFQIDN